MIWRNSISELDYYNPIPGVPCRCEILIYPTDLLLQGDFNKGSGSYTLQVEVLSPDGETTYADNSTSSPYFESYFANNPFTGKHFFNLRLKSFVPVMCTKVCYILHVTILDGSAVLFDKYTERYCQSSCCDLARDIDIVQASIVDTGGTTTGTVTASENPKVSECGDPIITLRTQFDCYDKFTGYYHGTPGTTLSGTASFGFQNISNFKGRVVRRPREITREYSYNCRLQRVESQTPYLLQGFEFFPAWKMNEIEAQLHSTRIWVDDVRYEYNGGTPFSLISDCREVFRLEAQLVDCIQRQVFGCDSSCAPTLNFDGAMMMYVIPEGYEGGDFFNESREYIGEDYEAVLTWFRSQAGITEVNDIDVSSLDCAIYKAFSVSGDGYIPTHFFYDKTAQGKKVFGAVHSSLEDLCDVYGGVCPAPDMGSPVVTEDTCPVPDMGSPVITDMTASDIPLAERGEGWVISESASDSPWIPASSASLYDGQVLLNLYAYNEAYTEDPEAPGEPVFINGDLIAVIGGTGRPEYERVLDSTNSNMPENTVLTIDKNGNIYYSGDATATDSDSSIIELTDIRYNIYGA